MASASVIANVRLRQPNLPAVITDEIINIYLDDAAIEFPKFGIATTDEAYEKMLSLYALHGMTMSGVIRETSSESVKDVSASYVTGTREAGNSIYYQEFRRLLRRRKSPYFVLKIT